MKYSFTPFLIIALIGCGPAAPLSHQKLLVLPSGKFQINGVMSDLAGALSRLGPPDKTQVDMTVCPNLPFASVQETKEALNDAGYDRIGFAHIEGAELALCQAGANNSFKPTPLRGAA